jgi:hypothetical protein
VSVATSVERNAHRIFFKIAERVIKFAEHRRPVDNRPGENISRYRTARYSRCWKAARLLIDDGRIGLQVKRFGTDCATTVVGEPVMVLVVVLFRWY